MGSSGFPRSHSTSTRAPAGARFPLWSRWRCPSMEGWVGGEPGVWRYFSGDAVPYGCGRWIQGYGGFLITRTTCLSIQPPLGIQGTKGQASWGPRVICVLGPSLVRGPRSSPAGGLRCQPASQVRALRGCFHSCCCDHRAEAQLGWPIPSGEGAQHAEDLGSGVWWALQAHSTVHPSGPSPPAPPLPPSAAGGWFPGTVKHAQGL